MTPIRIGSRWRDKGIPGRIVEVVGVRGKLVIYDVLLRHGRGRGCGDVDWWHKLYELVAEPTTEELLADRLRRVEGS